MTCELMRESANALATCGFVVLRQFFESRAARGRDRQGLGRWHPQGRPRARDIRFQYVPMMTAETPVSLSLLDRAGAVAAAVFDAAIPTRAKGTRYRGESLWHRDSDLPLSEPGLFSPTSSRWVPIAVCSA